MKKNTEVEVFKFGYLMRNLLYVFNLMFFSLVVGCASIDPLSMEVTDYDREMYETANEPQKSYGQFRILVLSEPVRNQTDETYDQRMAESARVSVMKYFSNLGWFETIDDKNGLSLDVRGLVGNDGRVNEKAIEGAAVDFILSVKSSVAYPGHHFKWHEFWGRGRYTSSASKANGADVTTEFSLIKVCDGKPLLSRRFRSRRLCDSSRTILKAIDGATDANASKFAQIVASQLLPAVRVLETRGHGRCARIRMGENYMARPASDEVPATVVEFFTFEKGIENRPDGKPTVDKVPFARGTVIRAVNSRECWVEVDAWEKAKVHKGHFVRTSNESIEQLTRDEF